MSLVPIVDQAAQLRAQRAEDERNRAHWQKRVRDLLERAPAQAAATRRSIRMQARALLTLRTPGDPTYEQRVRDAVTETWLEYDDQVRAYTGEAALLVGLGVMDPAAADLLVRSLERGEQLSEAPRIDIHVEPARAEVHVENTIPERQTLVTVEAQPSMDLELEHDRATGALKTIRRKPSAA